jgi:LemA protein
MVEVVKGYAKHEKEVLIKITEVRGHTLAAINETDYKQGDELGRILALAEAYPNLKADQNFLHLQRVIADVEEHLQAARRLYNQSVKEFNTRLETFPSRIIGSSMNLSKKEFYTATSEQKENVKIKL